MGSTARMENAASMMASSNRHGGRSTCVEIGRRCSGGAKRRDGGGRGFSCVEATSRRLFCNPIRSYAADAEGTRRTRREEKGKGGGRRGRERDRGGTLRNP